MSKERSKCDNQKETGMDNKEYWEKSAELKAKLSGIKTQLNDMPEPDNELGSALLNALKAVTEATEQLLQETDDQVTVEELLSDD